LRWWFWWRIGLDYGLVGFVLYFWFCSWMLGIVASVLLHLAEAFVGSVVLLLDLIFVAAEALGGLFRAEVVVGDGDAGGFVAVADVGFDPGHVFFHLHFEVGGLHAPDAAEFPGEGDHLFDGEPFGVVCGLEGFGEGLQHPIEFWFFFGGEEQGFGGESMFEGIVSDAEFAFGRDWAIGMSAVSARSTALFA